MISSKTPPKISTSNEEKNIDNGKPLYWDERDKYSDEQNALLGRLGAQKFGKSIGITELNTVILRERYTEEEILFEKIFPALSSAVTRSSTLSLLFSAADIVIVSSRSDFNSPTTSGT